MDRYQRWREVADLLDLKARERIREEWMVSYYTLGKKNATFTAQHFNISRKAFHKWLRRFKNLNTMSKAWLINLKSPAGGEIGRKRYPYYGKKKLKALYEKEYSEELSAWKIERVIT